MSIRMFSAALLAVALALTAIPARAHSGHDHGAEQPAPSILPAQPGFGADGTAFQAVLALQPEGVLLYLADMDTNAPVAGAVIEAEAPGWQGTAEPTGAKGVYRLAWSPPPEGADITLLVLAGGTDDLILIPAVAAPATLETTTTTTAAPNPWLNWGVLATAGFGALAGLVLLSRRRKTAAAILVAVIVGGGEALAHAGEDHGDAPAPAAVTAPGTAITMTKATQFLLGIRTARVEPREAADSQRVLGRVVPDPAGFAKVQASQPARVVSDPAFPLPVPGQMVTKGQVLVVLEPTLTSVERSDTRASLYRVESEIAIQERDLARQETLAGILPAKTIETTRIRLSQLRREKAQIAGTALGRDLVSAPVSGVVTDVHVVPGEVVNPDNVMVEIVDPALLRVEAVIHDIATAGRISGAKAATRLLPDEVFTLALLGVSPRIDARDQGIHALFQVDAKQATSLRLGLPVDVYLATGATRMANSVPRDAVTELGGRRVVFVRVAPEIFEARPVIVRQTVGPLAEIEGVAPGELVVVQGVDQLRAVR